jgi:hypothetical protein
VNVTTVPWGENERMSIHGKFFHKCFPSLIDFFSIFHRFIFIYFILFFVILFCFIQGKRQNVISHLYTLIHIIGYKLFCCECWLCPLLVLSTLSVFICRGPVEWPYIFTKKIQKNETLDVERQPNWSFQTYHKRARITIFMKTSCVSNGLNF